MISGVSPAVQNNLHKHAEYSPPLKMHHKTNENAGNKH